MVYWHCPPLWRGETVFVLGGGASLRRHCIGSLRGRGRVLAINDAFLLAPWADLLYWADRKWFDWNRGDIGRHVGGFRVTRANIPEVERDGLAFHSMLHNTRDVVAQDRSQLAGPDSGANALNLALHLGAARAILLGFDMRPGHWHERHRQASDPVSYSGRFIPHHEKMAPILARAGLEVRNATPGSALTCYPAIDLNEALA